MQASANSARPACSRARNHPHHNQQPVPVPQIPVRMIISILMNVPQAKQGHPLIAKRQQQTLLRRKRTTVTAVTVSAILAKALFCLVIFHQQMTRLELAAVAFYQCLTSACLEHLRMWNMTTRIVILHQHTANLAIRIGIAAAPMIQPTVMTIDIVPCSQYSKPSTYGRDA